MARIFGGGTSGPAQIHVVQDGEFFIVGPEHNGMIIQYTPTSNYGFGIGVNSEYPVPAGTQVTIHTKGGQSYLNLQDWTTISVWGAGWNEAYAYWYLPENTIATITKVDDEDTWIITGAGLAKD